MSYMNETKRGMFSTSSNKSTGKKAGKIALKAVGNFVYTSVDGLRMMNTGKYKKYR